MKVLIIEDSPEVVEAVTLCFQLRWPGAQVLAATDGRKGVETLAAQQCDMVILDINLPEMDGFQVMEKIRSFSNVPVIFVTVRGTVADQARGLELGADDYIVKPFKPRDLVDRVDQVLHHTRLPQEVEKEPVVRHGVLTLNVNTGKVLFKDLQAKLTPTEVKLLYTLMKNSDRSLSTNEIMREVWGQDDLDSALAKACILRIQKKLNDDPPHIILLDKDGEYRFIPPVL